MDLLINPPSLQQLLLAFLSLFSLFYSFFLYFSLSLSLSVFFHSHSNSRSFSFHLISIFPFSLLPKTDHISFQERKPQVRKKREKERERERKSGGKKEILLTWSEVYPENPRQYSHRSSFLIFLFFFLSLSFFLSLCILIFTDWTTNGQQNFSLASR